jgi:DUF4097 and DUF4098 domain-containing protein YvlB
MFQLLRPLVLLTVTVISASALTEEKVNETRDAKPNGKLIVDVDFGTIEVMVGDNDKVVLAAYRKIEASSKEQEQEYLATAPITITTNGSDVTVRARREKKGDSWKFWNSHASSSMDAQYTLRVPATFNANLQTAGGDISAKNLTGTIKADTSGGDLEFERVHGSINAESSGGQIEVTACEGAIDVETSGGRIGARGGSGSLSARTSGGAISAKDFAGDTKVETSGGWLDLANIGGKLTGGTSGGSILAVLSSPVPGDVILKTSAGSIKVIAPSSVALSVDAETSAGDVTSDLPITTTRAGHERLKGTINGGGKSLILRTGAGSIVIKSASEIAQR